jgi:hypothetical protein
MRWTHPLFHRPAPDVMAPVAASTWEDGPCGSPCWVSIWRRASSTCMAWTSLPPCVIGMEATRCSSGRCGRSPASPARSIPHWSKRVHHSLEELNAERGIRSRACAQSYDHELFCWEYRQELLVDSPGEVDVRRHGGAKDAIAVAPRQPQIGSGRSVLFCGIVVNGEFGVTWNWAESRYDACEISPACWVVLMTVPDPSLPRLSNICPIRAI